MGVNDRDYARKNPKKSFLDPGSIRVSIDQNKETTPFLKKIQFKLWLLTHPKHWLWRKRKIQDIK